jgi:hypothetical protein
LLFRRQPSRQLIAVGTAKHHHSRLDFTKYASNTIGTPSPLLQDPHQSPLRSLQLLSDFPQRHLVPQQFRVPVTGMRFPLQQDIDARMEVFLFAIELADYFEDTGFNVENPSPREPVAGHICSANLR